MQGWPGEIDMAYGQIIGDSQARNAMGQPISHVVFDYGNVLVYWDPQAAMRGRYDDETVQKFLDNDVSSFYDACDFIDEGHTLQEGYEFVKARASEYWADLFKDYLDHFALSLVGQVEGMDELIADLRSAGIGVWGLSNWQQDLFVVAQERFSILQQMNGSCVSGFIRLRKPDPKCYVTALKTFGIDPALSVFVDDKSQNIQGANSIGMRGIRFNDPATLREALREAKVAI